MSLNVQRLASDFRQAVDSTDLSAAPGFLPRFPHGCCRWAAVFIGNYLKESHSLAALHVMARHPSENYGHEWIEVENDIIDITLDQFGANFPKAYGGPPLAFHGELKVGSKETASDIAEFREIPGIETVYRQVASQMQRIATD